MNVATLAGLMALGWALLGGGTAVAMELAMRRGWSYHDWWFLYVVGAVIVNVAVYKMVVGNPNGWLATIILFSVVTALSRIGLAFALTHEPVSVPTIVAAVALTSVALFNAIWKLTHA